MSAIIFLARHCAHADVGNILSGRSDIGLSAFGREQAHRLAQACAVRGVAAVQASPRARASETAEIIARHLNLACELAAPLDEIDFGSWAGRSFAELEADSGWRRWNSERHIAVPPGGEPMATATARIVHHLDRLATSGQGPVLCVSHCDMIRGAIAHYLGLGLDCLLRFEIDPGSISALSIADRGGRLLSLNEVPQ